MLKIEHALQTCNCCSTTDLSILVFTWRRSAPTSIRLLAVPLQRHFKLFQPAQRSDYKYLEGSTLAFLHRLRGSQTPAKQSRSWVYGLTP